MKGNDIFIPADKLVQVNCKADVWYNDEMRQMMLNSISEQTPEGLRCTDNVV